MKRIILLGLLISSLATFAQDFYSDGNCRASFKFEVNPNIYTLVPATAINFYDTSEGDIKSWYWDCGDSLTSTEQNPMFVFNHPVGGPTVKISPYRTITLTIVTDSCKSTFSQLINIIDGTLYQDQSCMAHFKYYETARDSAEGTVSFKFVNGSMGDNLKYNWQFGDFETSTEFEPEIKFSMKNTDYKVCLSIVGADSCSSTFCETVYLEYPEILPQKCEAAFGYDAKYLSDSTESTTLFNFYGRSFPEAKEWFWDFGDGTTSNEPNPTHVYTMPPMNDSMKMMYNPFRQVCLTIKTANECKVSVCQTIQIDNWNPEPEKCPVYFKYYQPTDIVSIPEVVPIQLVDVTEGNVISRLWKFEDGSTSTEKEPLVSFNIFQPIHKVCLTVTFADSCINTFCDAVYLNNGYTDTVIIDDPYIEPGCPYYIKVDGGFPIQMSSCAGWASASVYFGDSLITPEFISWSTGDTLSTVEGLCPTQTYTVKALMPGGCVVWTNFELGADGSVTPITPVNWWLSGEREKIYIRSDVDKGMKVEWRLCDGTMVEADSIPLDAINCGGNLSNMIVKDAQGNVVYTENIALKGSFTAIKEVKMQPLVKLWPNPVSSKLNIKYSGEYLSEINVEICDIMGKRVSTEIMKNITNGLEFSIETENMRPGIYICRISSAGKTISSEKFIRR